VLVVAAPALAHGVGGDGDDDDDDDAAALPFLLLLLVLFCCSYSSAVHTLLLLVLSCCCHYKTQLFSPECHLAPFIPLTPALVENSSSLGSLVSQPLVHASVTTCCPTLPNVYNSTI